MFFVSKMFLKCILSGPQLHSYKLFLYKICVRLTRNTFCLQVGKQPLKFTIFEFKFLNFVFFL